MEVETIKNLGLILAIAVFTAYVSYIWGRYGVQKSISISWYDLEVKDRWTFRVFIWTLSLAIIISGIGWYNKYFLASGILLSIVGIFTKIKTKWKYIIHLLGAIFGILSAYLGLFLENIIIGYLAVAVTLFHVSLTYILGNRKHIIWNMEIACFTYIMLGILYYINVA